MDSGDNHAAGLGLAPLAHLSLPTSPRRSAIRLLGPPDRARPRPLAGDGAGLQAAAVALPAGRNGSTPGPLKVRGAAAQLIHRPADCAAHRRPGPRPLPRQPDDVYGRHRHRPFPAHHRPLRQRFPGPTDDRAGIRRLHSGLAQSTPLGQHPGRTELRDEANGPDLVAPGYAVSSTSSHVLFPPQAAAWEFRKK